MKKTLSIRYLIKYCVNRLLRGNFIVIAFSLLFVTTNLIAKPQAEKLTIKNSSISIQEILDEIEAKTKYSFILQNENVDTKRKISVDFDNITVKEILETIFKDKGIKFEISDKNLIILQKKIKKKAQSKEKILIKGLIVDEEGESLPGVSITQKGTYNGVISNIDGEYSLSIPLGSEIIFSFIGKETQTIVFDGKTKINVVMKEKANELDEVTVVAFGKQNTKSVIASITSIKPDDLKVPVSNLTNALAGKMSGVISYQRSGEPGEDNAEFFIRGVTTFGYKVSPLILLDGFEISTDDLARLEPENIASFSIIKDATGTALYGARGANGVILVTTKTGREGDLKVNFKHETSIAMPTKLNKTVGGVEYMQLYNEAQNNDDPFLEPFYSKQKIESTKRDINSFAYPNVDWYDELFENSVMNNRYNLNLSGGGKKIQYYLSASYAKDRGILKVDKKNDFNNNIEIDRYNLRGNINLNLTSTTKAAMKFYSVFRQYNGPVESASDIFKQVMKANPVDYPKYFEPDVANKYTKHILFGNIGDAKMANPYANMVKGYKDSFSSNILSQFSIEQDLGMITEGLSARVNASIKVYSDNTTARKYEPYYYGIKSYSDVTDKYVLQPLKKGSSSLGSPEVSKNTHSKTYFEGALNYNRTFDVHRVVVQLVGTREESLNTH
jgi:TonB-linked SusC/RagA family outer membrane protein